MSDTLQEREDQAMNNDDFCDECHSYKHMPWCSSYTEPDIYDAVAELREQRTTSAHQPAARGGGEQVRVDLINGIEGQCIGVNDYRICGPKPWGGGSIAQSWTTDKNDVLRAFLTPDQKHAWLADDLQVVSVNQHQALVAERERLERMLAAVVNAHYGLAYRSIGSGDGIPEKEAAEIGRWWLDYTASDA